MFKHSNCGINLMKPRKTGSKSRDFVVGNGYGRDLCVVKEPSRTNYECSAVNESSVITSSNTRLRKKITEEWAEVM